MFTNPNQFKVIVGFFSSLSVKVSAALIILILFIITWWGANTSKGNDGFNLETEHTVTYQTFSSLVQTRGELQPPEWFLLSQIFLTHALS
ncbi:hypothetical protein L3081_18630 [Colwellia sp. MSW7]|uniref:Uncharacterized protein n=1 Tax=Colwellia maritima TaxID=2912588 RepID=A0ABS9X480_9GAMM|nr:hypothetical protein [Colwellia maritima]MCI2285038.1 hypothetical protein [Colwellia maritima]